MQNYGFSIGSMCEFGAITKKIFLNFAAWKNMKS